jgi:hypothetical protein
VKAQGASKELKKNCRKIELGAKSDLSLNFLLFKEKIIFLNSLNKIRPQGSNEKLSRYL